MLLIKEMARTELSVPQINMKKENAVPLKNCLTRKEDAECSKQEAEGWYSTWATRQYVPSKSDTAETTRAHTHMQCPELLKAPGEVL